MDLYVWCEPSFLHAKHVLVLLNASGVEESLLWGDNLPMLMSFRFPFLLFFCETSCIFENTSHPASAKSIILEDLGIYDVTTNLLIASKSSLIWSSGCGMHLRIHLRFCCQSEGSILSMLLLICLWIFWRYHSLSAHETQPQLSLFHHPSCWLSKLDRSAKFYGRPGQVHCLQFS